MGSKMDPNCACMFVGYMEEAILSLYTGFIPQLYKRYINDVVGAACCDRKDLEDFIAYVSVSHHPSLQYTHTISETSLPFLDINLHKAGKCHQTSAYYKETNTHTAIYIISLRTLGILRAAFLTVNFCASAVFVQMKTISTLKHKRCVASSESGAVLPIYLVKICGK